MDLLGDIIFLGDFILGGCEMAEILKLYASLHMHSTHSDGVYTPKELVEIAKKLLSVFKK